MNIPSQIAKWALAIVAGATFAAGQDLKVAPGNSLKLTFRGLPDAEAVQVNGNYKVDGAGTIRLPYVGNLNVAGMTANQAAKVVEDAYRRAAIYTRPTVEAAIIQELVGPDDGATISVGGQVNRAGKVPFKPGMRLIEALQAAGDRTAFGSRNIELLRDGKLKTLDYREAATKNFELKANDVITVKQRGPLEIDHG